MNIPNYSITCDLPMPIVEAPTSFWRTPVQLATELELAGKRVAGQIGGYDYGEVRAHKSQDSKLNQLPGSPSGLKFNRHREKEKGDRV